MNCKTLLLSDSYKGRMCTIGNTDWKTAVGYQKRGKSSEGEGT